MKKNSRLAVATDARIALGRCGVSLPTDKLLEFQLAHARARDAVHQPFASEQLAGQLAELGLPTITLHSSAAGRQEYLQRPDLGRRLAPESAAHLRRSVTLAGDPLAYNLALVVADGLSAPGVHASAIPLLRAFLPLAKALNWRLPPVCLVTQGRVAIGDEIASLLKAQAVAILIGERPGLTSPDSLGIYLTYAPVPGTTDERRNCISNVRRAGLLPTVAAQKLCYLTSEALRRKLSGVNLKDEISLPDLSFQMTKLLEGDDRSSAQGRKQK